MCISHEEKNILTNFIIIINFNRENEIFNFDGSGKSVDAGSLFLQRERGSLSQHHRTQCLRQDLPKRQSPLQHQVKRKVKLYILKIKYFINLIDLKQDFADTFLSNEFETVSIGSADVLSPHDQL